VIQSGSEAAAIGGNAAQAAYWGGAVGERWALRQRVIDAMMAPMTAAVMGAAAAVPGEQVLDVGCGSGETALLLARQRCAVTGVDISPPLLALARRRASELPQGVPMPDFVEGDAAALTALPGAPFDLLVSRFGVMFFDDPAGAFSVLRGHLKPGARLAFVCWRAPQENAWVTVPVSALDGLVAPGAANDPDAPGPFAFARQDRVRAILADAGFAQVRMTPFDALLTLGEAGPASVSAAFMAEVGPAARAIAELAPEARQLAIDRLAVALEPHRTDGQLRLGGAVWIVEAVNPA
jgi:SAM-dependent methyltransferase